MSFIFTAVGASTATAAIGTAVIGTALYSADQQRKAIHGQQDALRAAQEEDARKTAEAETASQVAANAQLADSKRRRRNSALGLGDTGDGSSSTLGGPANVLASGGPTAAARAGAAGAAAGSSYGTALGAGAPTSYGATGRSYVPKTTNRQSAV